MFRFFALGFLALLSSVAALDEPVFRKDYKYNVDVLGWMKLHNVPAKWHDAWLRCQMEGAILASPLHKVMGSTMTELMRGKTNVVFTGIHATFSKGDYFSIEGIPLSNIPVTWAPMEPNNEDDNEDCLVMYSDGALADANCSEVMPYICYKKFDQDYDEIEYEARMEDCGTVDEGYKFHPETGSCYKFHTNPRTWSRAYMTCAAEGGYLAIINSEREAEVLGKIFSSIPTKSIRVIKNQVLAFIGLHDWGEHGSWMTIDGKTLDEAGYSRWGKTYGEPNNVTDASTNFQGEYCGSMYRNGDLNDLWCDYVISFICEKEANTPSHSGKLIDY